LKIIAVGQRSKDISDKENASFLNYVIIFKENRKVTFSNSNTNTFLILYWNPSFIKALKAIYVQHNFTLTIYTCKFLAEPISRY